MSKNTLLLRIHPENPQARLINQVVDMIKSGGVVIIPTDSGYSLCCGLEQKDAVARIRQIRQLDIKHLFTMFCKDFANVSIYAEINNLAFRFLKTHTPGPLTFVLKATREVPRRLLHPSRRTIGIRIPDNKIMLAILAELGEPLMSVSVDEFAETWPILDPQDIWTRYHKQVDLVIDGGQIAAEPTTMIDLISGMPEIIRQGKYLI